MKQYWKCDVCNKEFETLEEAEKCEKIHKEQEEQRQKWLTEQKMKEEEVREAFALANKLKNEYDKTYCPESLARSGENYYINGEKTTKDVWDHFFKKFFWGI